MDWALWRSEMDWALFGGSGRVRPVSEAEVRAYRKREADEAARRERARRYGCPCTHSAAVDLSSAAVGFQSAMVGGLDSASDGGSDGGGE